ncbi:hypothetical protein C1Y19_35040, partial [Pseudomonas sp. MPR-LB3]|uniref:hypothetical protein n=1 Tax=Pseudomonas sp. MPR-LB3 TaxID=2070625 RepID=UPI000CB9254B
SKGHHLATGEGMFSNETMQSLRELGATLADVRRRLLKEGGGAGNGILANKSQGASNDLCNNKKTNRKH